MSKAGSWFASPQKFAYCKNGLFAWQKRSMFCEAGKVAASWPNIYKFNIGSTANAEESGVQDFFSPRADGGNAHTHGAARSGESGEGRSWKVISCQTNNFGPQHRIQ